MRISRRERIVLTVGALFMACFFLYIQVVEPLVKEQRHVRSQLEAKTLLLKKYYNVLSQRQALEEERDRLKERLALLRAKLLPGDKPPLAAAELQQILKSAAAETGVNVTSERILDPVSRSHYMEIPVEINVKCSASELATLLFQIENSPRHLSVRKLSIRADHKIDPKEVSATVVVIGLIKSPGAI